MSSGMERATIAFEVDRASLNMHLGNTPNVTLEGGLAELLGGLFGRRDIYCENCGRGSSEETGVEGSFRFVSGEVGPVKSGEIADTVAAGARIAVSILKEWISAEDLARVASGEIHPSDVCDANIATYGAFAAIHFDEPNAANQAHADWINAVFDAALANIEESLD